MRRALRHTVTPLARCRVKRDVKTPDLFAVRAPAPIAGTQDYRARVAELVSQMLKECGVDRYEIAARMSRLAGREISKYMLDAWSAESREDHNLPFALAPVLEAACESHLLSAWLAEIRGGRLYVGRDAIAVQVGLLKHTRDELNEQIRELNEQLRGAR
jgi:hypothetical protein